MINNSPFSDLMKRVQRGEPEAVSELVQRYEPDVRLLVRTMLTDSQLRAQFDSADITQSVLRRFCLQSNDGRFQVDSPEQLVALLKKIAYHRFLDLVRYSEAQVRDIRRTEGRDDALMTYFFDGAGPSTIAAWRDEFQQIRRRMTDDEFELARSWVSGRSWVELGGEDRKEQDRLRHKLENCFKRIARQLTQMRDEVVTEEFLKAVFQWSIEQTAWEANF